MKRGVIWMALAMMLLGGVARAEGLANPFYAMDTGTDSARLSAAEQAALVKQAGFAGMDMVYHDLGKVKALQAALDKEGLKLFGVYFQVQLPKEGQTDLSQLGPLCEALKGRETIIMMPLYSKAFKPGVPEGEAVALETLRRAGEIAASNGLRVAIYPHVGAYAERVDVAAALAKKVNLKNVGMMFNLCHFLKTDGKDAEARVKEAMPVLFAFTVCGADRDGATEKNWSRLIMTLDKGNYDVAQFVALFIKQGYKGPIGLQHYGIKGDPKENLGHSMDGWRRVSAAAAKAQAEK